MQPARELIVCVLGGAGVGKSALTHVWSYGLFVEAYDPTIQEDYLRKQVAVEKDTCLLKLDDTTSVDATLDRRIQVADAFVILYSIIDPSTWREVQSIWDRIVHVKATDMIPWILLGHKCDLEDQRAISHGQGEQLARSLGAYRFYESSAKLRINTDEALQDVVHAFAAYAVVDRKPVTKPPNPIRRYLWNREAKKLETSEREAVVDRLRPPVVVLPGRFFDDLARLFSQSSEDPLSDCRIVVGDREIACHRVVLALRSPYFRVLFQQALNATGSRRELVLVRLPDSQWSYDAVFALVRYVYRPYALHTLSTNLQTEVQRLNSEVFGVGAPPSASAPVDGQPPVLGRKKHPPISFGASAAANLPAAVVSSSVVADALGGYAELAHLADVELVAGNLDATPVPAHRAILAARCPAFFGTMFASAFPEASASTIRMGSWSPETLDLVLQFIYTDRVQVEHPSLLLDLLVAAHMMELPRLVTLCEKATAARLTCDNVFQIYPAAEIYGARQLIDQCEYMIAANFELLARTAAFDSILTLAAKSRIAALHAQLETAKAQSTQRLHRPRG